MANVSFENTNKMIVITNNSIQNTRMKKPLMYAQKTKVYPTAIYIKV